MKYIDNFLNKITMYRLVLYGLTGLVALSFILSLFGVLGYSPLGILASWLTLCFSCYFSNLLFSKIIGAQLNTESSWITALILTLILFPVSSFHDVWLYALIGAGAMISKYLLAIHKKHIFNPVAIALFFAGLLGVGASAWWVSGKIMFLPILVLGFLVLRKTRRFEMFGSFFTIGILSIVATSLSQGFDPMESVYYAIFSGPILFFGTIMLTEPLTTPPYKQGQIVYAGIVGLIFGLSFHIGNIYSSPELALVLGNLFAYFISPKDRLKLVLKEKINLTPDTYEFIWQSDKKLSYYPGQYLEWTLEHQKPDSRGNRRYFTASSSPTEEDIKLGIKTYPNPSSFKQKLVSLNPGDTIFASQLAGEFTLPTNLNKKMVWIAGGIGVTPFRSMAQYMTDKKEKRDVVFFYSNKTSKDIVYYDVFSKAKEFGLDLHCVCNTQLPDDTMPDLKFGFIDEAMIKAEVPDYKERLFYISGPHGMVTAFEETLKKIGVPSGQIKIDFFPGFV